MSEAGTPKDAGLIAFVFVMNVAIVGGAFLFETVRQTTGAGVAGLALWEVVFWFSPYLSLALASLFGLGFVTGTMRRGMLRQANANAISAIGIGISIAGLLHGIGSLYATYANPLLADLGDKQNLYNVALLTFGGLLQFLAHGLRYGAELKAENEQFL